MRKQPVTRRVLLRHCPDTHSFSVVSHHLRCGKHDDTSVVAAGILITSMLFSQWHDYPCRISKASIPTQLPRRHSFCNYCLPGGRLFGSRTEAFDISATVSEALYDSIEARYLPPAMSHLSYTKPADTTTTATEKSEIFTCSTLFLSGTICLGSLAMY
jgi:hypothetical protein